MTKLKKLKIFIGAYHVGAVDTSVNRTRISAFMRSKQKTDQTNEVSVFQEQKLGVRGRREEKDIPNRGTDLSKSMESGKSPARLGDYW